MARRETSIYANIAQELENKIKSGAFKPGAVIPSERLLKELYKVERTTIRRALEILLEKGLIVKKAGIGSVVVSENDVNVDENKQIEHKIREINSIDAGCDAHSIINAIGKVFYIFPDRASLVRREKSGISKAIECLKNICRQMGLEFQVVEDVEKLEALIAENQTYGAVFSESLNQNAASLLEDKKIPYVLMLGRGDKAVSVGVDNEGAMSYVINELYTKGHRKIAFVGSDESFYGERARRLAFENSMRSLGLETDLLNAGGSDEQSGYNRTKELLRYSKDAFTAVCAVNIEVARGAIKALEEKGKRVPGDVSVVGFGACDVDDEIYSACFDVESLCNEVVFSLYKQHNFKCVCGCYTEITAKFGGNTLGDVPVRSNGRLSDFLL